MRNLKKILCLALVLSMVLAVVSGAAYTNYADDAELTVVNEDYLLAAQLLQDIGVVVGIEDEGKTYYKPDQLLTRAELARVLYVLYSAVTNDEVYNSGSLFDTLPTTFTDIEDHWAEGYIKYGQNMGYLNGKSAEIFDPDATVKAQEMATALLIVIGYKAADIAPNYPANVVKYGYATKGNLFTTGLSNAYQDETIGVHVVGFGKNVAGVYVDDAEKDLPLSAELTREEAFYMMYKAITKRSMVSKMDTHHNADGEYYYETGVNFLKKNFGLTFAQKEITDVVSGSAKYNFKGGYATEGTVVLDQNGKVVDFGYTAALNGKSNTVIGFGFDLSATDWDKNIGKEITGTLTTWGGKTYLTGYAFNYTATRTTQTGPKGSDVVVVKAKEVKADGDKIKVDGKAYAPYYTDGYRYIYNNATGVIKDAAGLAAVIESKVASNDEIVLKVIGDKLYGLFEEENFYATVSDVDKDGIATLTLLDGGIVKLTNKYELAKGDRIFGLFNMKNYEAAAKDLADEKIKYIADGLTLEFVKVAPTAIVNVAVDTANTKYYFENVNGTEFKLGAASDLATDFDGNYIAGVNGNVFVQNETAYWALYIVDGYCFEAVKTEKEQSIDLFVTSKSVVYNTTDNKTTYTFGLNTKADGKGTAYTYTTTVTGTAAALEGIAKGETVVYYYDAKTLAATGIKEFKVLTVADTLYKAEAAFANVDTIASRVTDVLAKIDEATDKYVQYRIVLKASGNKAYDKPVVLGSSATDAIPAAVAAKAATPNDIEILVPEYTYVQK